MRAAPGLLPDAARARAIGAPILGIVPLLSTHKRGYHMPADLIGPSDYSRRGPLNVPLNDDDCCALDVGLWPAHRLFVADMFARCRAGTQPANLAEFIGSPDGKKALYWAWTQGRRVDAYRGAGHINWWHGGIFRKLANRDGLWLAGWGRNGPLITPKPTGTFVQQLRARLRAEVAAGRRESDRLPVYSAEPGTPGRRGLTNDVLGVPVDTVLRWYGAPDPYGERSIQVGQKNDGVRYVELLFNSVVEGPGARDGYFSPALGQLVGGWQKRVGLKRVHGRIDKATLLKLGQPYAWQ